jgi:4-hydroxy-4-methyl-2-oxoglutarate aldolase
MFTGDIQMTQTQENDVKSHFFTALKKAEELNINENMSDEEVLNLIRKCRLTDLSDGMDAIGLVNIGTMSSEMRPIRHSINFVGFAYTIKLVPTQKRTTSYENLKEYYGLGLKNYMSEEFDFWTNVANTDLKDKVLVFDAGGYPAGVIGSENTMGWTEKGASGVVIDGGVRDSYECNLEDMKIFATKRTCNHYYGRLQHVSVQEPITCAGVCVRPGDIVSADDDGVLVIPRKDAISVVKAAVPIRIFDMLLRSDHYKNLGKESDGTISFEF